ncbi:Aspartic proteinase-like protein 2 [Platanthera guangdongensis]|uniref:Aspartic proteinase-like protein 2 n=1 Tax=Platanthera guangdongensis TaxID=2320717 RepID=A0ABR2MZE4_9ASPA
MTLKPEDYLIQQGSVDNAIIWCIGWQKNGGQGITILGDLILKDKIVVYDLANQRIGWKSYNCSQSVNVSTTSGKNEYVNSNQLDTSASSKYSKLRLFSTEGFVLLVYILAATALL